jgi:hypothetical protein
VSYRDDVDALYERAATLQRELAQAQAELARRDAELAAVRGTWQPGPQSTQLRELPAAETTIAHVIESLVPRTTAVPEPAWLGAYRTRLVEAARDRLDALDPESLVLVGAIIEELAVEPGHRPDVLDRLRPIVRYIGARR